MPDKITLEPYGGLANRMRAIDSAFELADICNADLEVKWEMSFELNCPFNRLFEIPENIELHEYHINGLVKRTRDNVVKNLAKIGIYLPSGYDIYLHDREIESYIENNTDFRELLDTTGSVYIRTVHRFYATDNSFNIFKPVPELQDKIAKLTASFSLNTVGVHIRRTDNTESIRHSPLKDFIACMQLETEVNPDTMFFLATDSIEVEDTLKVTFPDRIITYPKVLTRNTEEGIQDALVDMYCLSKTSKIFGSHYSSFSEVAAQLNNIKLNQIYRAA